MSDADDWVEVNLQVRGFTRKDREILEYCEPYMEYFWASRIVGILLDCDFKDAKTELNKFKVMTKDRGEFLA